MTSYQVDQLPGPIAILGEGPHWDIEKQSLYYVDILNGSVHRYSYEDNKVYSADVENEESVSFIIPVEGEKDKFAVGIGHRVGVLSWDGFATSAKIDRSVFEVESEDKLKGNRFNDGKADPVGRLVAGTMQKENHDAPPEERIGNLYSYSKESNVTHLRSNVAISNGLAWNEKNRKMYYIDSSDFRVREFNYDLEKGAIDEVRVLADFHVDGNKQDFAPDGMTIDKDGFLYVATWGGSKVLKIDPSNGKTVKTFEFPCEQITSCAFGGPELDILYVTSASFGDKPHPAGALFKVTDVGAKGLPMQKVKL